MNNTAVFHHERPRITDHRHRNRNAERQMASHNSTRYRYGRRRPAKSIVNNN